MSQGRACLLERGEGYRQIETAFDQPPKNARNNYNASKYLFMQVLVYTYTTRAQHIEIKKTAVHITE